eukprot:TRINITY_DN6948_c0_g1_i1.p2 TRINITY_DN6948_c0_g1~~TRINITY_DN6948_c0_g1_i1.p2  ORF type:complete len:162 (-),score=82.55 TRINITY_DN6948_c0_g1_i1:72-527(-)
MDKRVEDVNLIKKAPQGGKHFGQNLKRQEAELDRVAASYLSSNSDAKQEDVDNLKKKFVIYDLDGDNEINLDELKYMMEKMGQPKSHLELKKMISQVDTTGRGVITFLDFLQMMLGGSSSILKKILMFEELGKEKEKPKGLPAKKSFSDLP